MDGDFQVRANVYALRETETIERFEHALMMLTLTGYAVVVCHCEHVSSPPKWIHASQTDSIDLLNSGPGARAQGNPSEWGPAIVKFVIVSKAASVSTTEVLRVIAPHADAKVPVLFTQRS
jgi:hypothetical protein